MAIRDKPSAIRRQKWFLLCRSGFTLGTALVGLAIPNVAFVTIVTLLIFSLLSSGVAYWLDPFLFFDEMAQSFFIIIDTAVVFTILMVSGTDMSYFIPFFGVLIFTAIIEQPALLVAAAVGAAVLSGLASDGALGGVESIWTRAAFLGSSALYYWYAVLPDR